MPSKPRPSPSDLVLASIPLVGLDDERRPMSAASGCLTTYRGLRILFTVHHATANNLNWVALDGYDPANGTRVLPLGPLNFFFKGALASRFAPVDFAVVRVRDDFAPRWQHITPRNGIEMECPRTVLDTTLTATPDPDRCYGFAGIVHADRDSGAMYGDTQLEACLSFACEDDEWYHFGLNHSHPGDGEYRGCSGAPIIDSDGTLVALLVGRGKLEDSVRALPLARYRTAVDLSLGLEPRGRITPGSTGRPAGAG